MAEILIFGSRDWFDAGLISDTIWSEWTSHHRQLTVIHGGAQGADSIADFQARKVPGCEVDVFPPDYDQHGAKAPHIRNDSMLARNPHHAYAFWNGHSSGTKHMIDKCIKRGIRLTIHIHRIPPR